jgi:hypothetical protein
MPAELNMQNKGLVFKPTTLSKYLHAFPAASHNACVTDVGVVSGRVPMQLL